MPRCLFLFLFFKIAPITQKTLCAKKLDRDQIEQFKTAIRRNYFFEMWADGLPLRGFVGAVQTKDGEEHIYLSTHFHFSFAFNDDRIIQANLTTDASSMIELVDQGKRTKIK